MHASNTIITTFIATINGSRIGVRGDGHCLRRSLGKLWDSIQEREGLGSTVSTTERRKIKNRKQ
jgi:hypothetical protein